MHAVDIRRRLCAQSSLQERSTGLSSSLGSLQASLERRQQHLTVQVAANEHQAVDALLTCMAKGYGTLVLPH